jgi:DNA-binding response OmpR family regulator
MTSLLVLEDDEMTRTFLADNLTADGFELLVAASAQEALRLLETAAPDLAIFDVGLPDGSGLDLIARLRACDGPSTRLDPALPIIVVSGRATEMDRLRGLRRGADDYLVKPFSYPELLERVRALLRRTGERPRLGRLRAGDLTIDPGPREVYLRGRRIELSQKEFALLRKLASDPMRVFTKEELLRDVWGFRSIGTTRTLDSHACRLRRKLGEDGDLYVLNVWGVGYRLMDLAVAA